MRRGKRLTIFILLFVFGVLSVKNLLPYVAHESRGDCTEFGHLHLHPVAFAHDHVEFAQAQTDHEQSDGDCHEAKSITGYSLTPTLNFTFLKPFHQTSYQIVFLITNGFISPDLEPARKPPRYV